MLAKKLDPQTKLINVTFFGLAPNSELWAAASLGKRFKIAACVAQRGTHLHAIRKHSANVRVKDCTAKTASFHWVPVIRGGGAEGIISHAGRVAEVREHTTKTETSDSAFQVLDGFVAAPGNDVDYPAHRIGPVDI